MGDTAISVKGVNKSFRHYKNNHQRLRHYLLGRDAGEEYQLFSDLSLEIKKGEKVGMMGSYGTGKTTLMRLIAGLIYPDSGEINVDGEITSIFDHRLCFDGALSVMTNLQIKASVLGWPKDEIENREREILEFAELTENVNEPLRSLPKGSAVRLGFAISSRIKPDILLYDEGFNFGGPQYDEKFQDRFKWMTEGDDTTALISVVNLTLAKKFCDRGIVLSDGGIAFDGSIEDAVKYFKLNFRKAASIRKIEEPEPQADETMDSDDFGF